MSWFDIPGTMTVDLTRIGFDTKLNLAGVLLLLPLYIYICVKLLLVVRFTNPCFISLSGFDAVVVSVFIWINWSLWLKWCCLCYYEIWFFLMINSVDPDNIAFVEACSMIIWAILGCFLALFLFLIQLQNVFVLLIILTFLPSQRLLLRVYLCHSCIHNNFMERFH